MTPIPVITGPTAVGKTALSIEFARKAGAEIISFDSRQLYRGMDIGTAKPDPDELEVVPHHFIDEMDPRDSYSAGEYARRAWDRIADLRRRGIPVVCVGGSTLYLSALTQGIADIPEVSDETRTFIEERLTVEGSHALFDELIRIDPQAASTMDATKTQRLVRALSVYRQTGLPLSHFHETHKPPPFDFSVVVLNADRELLYDRINRRVDMMLELGLINEVKQLLDNGVPPDANAMRSIGYREPIRYLRGEIDDEEMRRLIKRNTRRYAKRQLTWFRRNEEYIWQPSTSSVADLAEVFEVDIQG